MLLESFSVAHFTRAQVCVQDKIWHGEVVGEVCGYTTHCQTHHIPRGHLGQAQRLSFCVVFVSVGFLGSVWLGVPCP